MFLEMALFECLGQCPKEPIRGNDSKNWRLYYTSAARGRQLLNSIIGSATTPPSQLMKRKILQRDIVIKERQNRYEE